MSALLWLPMIRGNYCAFRSWIRRQSPHNLADILVYNTENQTVVKVKIIVSKTDQLRKEVDIFIGIKDVQALIAGLNCSQTTRRTVSLIQR